jgi:hypothetical protein
MEPDTEHGRCHPPHPAFGRLCDIFTVAFRRNGQRDRYRLTGSGQA